MFGAPFKKPTRLRCWNWYPDELNKVCSLKQGMFSCGKSAEAGHEVLEFGGRSTSTAASYWPGLTKEWASALRSRTVVADSSPQAWQEVTLANEGKVKRHTLRGNTELTPKEVRNEEDLVSTAGCRNPAKVYGGPRGAR